MAEDFESKYAIEIQAFNKSTQYVSTIDIDDEGKKAMLHMTIYNFWYAYFKTRNDMACFTESVQKALEPVYSDNNISYFETELDKVICLTIKNSYDRFPANVNPENVGSTLFNYSYVKDYLSKSNNSL